MPQPAAATPAATRSMAASTHAFHVHIVAVTPSLLRAGGCWDARVTPQASRGVPPRPGFNPSALVPASIPRPLGPRRLGQAAARLALPSTEARLPIPLCQTVFSWQRRAEHEGPRNSRQIVPQFGGKPGLPRQRGGRLRLARADFQHRDAVRGQQSRKLGNQAAIGREAVRAAVQGGARLVAATSGIRPPRSSVGM